MDSMENSRRSSDMLRMNREPERINTNTDRVYNSNSIMSVSAVSSPSHSNGGQPSYSSNRPSVSHNSSGLISPPDSRRTSDDKAEPPPPLQTNPVHRQSLPSISEALGTKPNNPYVSPVSASAPTSHQFPYSQSLPPSAPRAYAPSEPTPYQPPLAPVQQRQASPPQTIQPPPFPHRHTDPVTFPDDPRRSSLAAIQPPPPPGPYAPRFEIPRYDSDPRATERMSNGYTHQPPPHHNPYPYTPSQGPMVQPPNGGPNFANPRYQQRDPRELGEPDLKVGSPNFQKGLKRHLEVFDYENSLAQINVASATLQEWSNHFHGIAQEQQRIVTIPDRMPTLESIEEMLMHHERIIHGLQRVKVIVYEQRHLMADHQLREQGGKPSRDYDDNQNMYDDDPRSQSYPGGSDGKKRRGRAAPPGRCHSCNRAETPEWRRGPDGARTLCNACGLHYAKLTRKNGMKQSQGANGSIRPKSMDDQQSPQ